MKPSRIREWCTCGPRCLGHPDGGFNAGIRGRVSIWRPTPAQSAVAGVRVMSDELVHRVMESMHYVPFDFSKRGQGLHPCLG